MGSHFAQNTTPNPCALLRHHIPLSGISTYTKHPQIHPKHPFFWPELEVAKTNYGLGNLDIIWAKCLTSGQNFSRSGRLPQYSSSSGLTWPHLANHEILVPSWMTDVRMRDVRWPHRHEVMIGMYWILNTCRYVSFLGACLVALKVASIGGMHLILTSIYQILTGMYLIHTNMYCVGVVYVFNICWCCVCFQY